MQNYRETVMSQYANSPTLSALIDNWNTYIDPATTIDGFFDTIMNVDTATGYGLDVWGRIVGVSRVLKLPATLQFFGFKEGNTGAPTDYQPFGQAPFYSQPGTSNYILSDDAYRTLILIKAAANIAATDARSLNRLLTSLFAGRGRVYVNDYEIMVIRYTFEFVLQPFELAIMTQSGVLPKASGVHALLLQMVPGTAFGFAEAGLTNSAPFGSKPFCGDALNVG